MQCQCGKEVVDGLNGDVLDPPPWEDHQCGGEFSGTALCWECENRLEGQGEVARQARLIRAAERYYGD